MKKLLLVFLCLAFLAVSVQALIEAPEEYQIKVGNKKVEKTETKKAPSIPTFDETVIVEVQEEVVPQEKAIPVTKESSLLSVLAKIVTIALIMAIVILGIWTLINRKKN